jgi:hypothetical protein
MEDRAPILPLCGRDQGRRSRGEHATRRIKNEVSKAVRPCVDFATPVVVACGTELSDAVPFNMSARPRRFQVDSGIRLLRLRRKGQKGPSNRRQRLQASPFARTIVLPHGDNA